MAARVTLPRQRPCLPPARLPLGPPTLPARAGLGWASVARLAALGGQRGGRRVEDCVHQLRVALANRRVGRGALDLLAVLRIRWLPESATHRLPWASRAIWSGFLNCAAVLRALCPAAGKDRHRAVRRHTEGSTGLGSVMSGPKRRAFPYPLSGTRPRKVERLNNGAELSLGLRTRKGRPLLDASGSRFPPWFMF